MGTSEMYGVNRLRHQAVCQNSVLIGLNEPGGGEFRPIAFTYLTLGDVDLTRLLRAIQRSNFDEAHWHYSVPRLVINHLREHKTNITFAH